MGISRSSGRGVRRRNAFKQRRDAFNAYRLGSEELEPKRVLTSLATLTPDLVGGSDTGLDATDNYTSDTTPTFSINPVGLGGFDAGDEIRLFAGTNQVGSHTVVAANFDATTNLWTGGPIQITSDQVIGGNPNAINFTMRHFDGSLDPASNARSINIDDEPPTAPAVNTFATNQNIVNFNSQEIRLVRILAELFLQAPQTGLAVLALPLKNVFAVTVNGVTYTETPAGTNGFTLGTGTWQLDLGQVATPPAEFADGTYPVQVTYTDQAGNSITQTEPNGLLVDTVQPQMTAITGPGATATFVDGSTIPITVSLSEPIDVNTLPGGSTLSFTVNNGPRTAALDAANSNANTLIYNYTVNESIVVGQPGDITTGTNRISNIDSSAITLGMAVIGLGIPDGTVVEEFDVDPGTGSGSPTADIILSDNATVTAVGNRTTTGDVNNTITITV